MKKKIYSVISLACIISLTACSVVKPVEEEKEIRYQKEISRISRYESNIPDDYEYYDYEKTALALDDLLFGEELEGTYLPLMWEDTTYNTFGIPAYVGDGRMHQDGAQEAVTAIAAILSATQLGVDKSDQDGKNYVSMMSAFYSEEEKIVLNNPSGSSETTSMWYLLYPAILFTQVSCLYPEEIQIREQALSCIESWYKAYEIMMEEETFDYTGFNFKTMEPYKNDIWSEPDSAAGIAMLLYYGYELTGRQDYLDGAIKSMEYLNSYFGSPMYEALLYFAPALAAMFNAGNNTNLNVKDLLDDMLNGGSIPRGGWGSIVGTWGDYSMNGLMGSTSDGGGYAFAMNTFTAAYAVSPLVKYDSRYASAIGKWILNLAGNARYFFADQTNTENQSSALSELATEFAKNTNNIVPYEGIRKGSNSKTPWFGGDPTVYGWAETDFSLYSGAHVGLLASIVEETNVEAILRINVTKADLFHQTYPSYLLYNPYDTEKTVTYEVTSSEPVDLYNNVTKQYIAKGVSEKTEISIAAEDSVVVIELPSDITVNKNGLSYEVNGEVIGSDAMTVNVTNLENLSKVNGTFHLELAVISTLSEDTIERVEVYVDSNRYEITDFNNIKFNVKDLGTGSKNFEVSVLMKSGLQDKAEIRLILE